jgi:hypothetical protein
MSCVSLFLRCSMSSSSLNCTFPQVMVCFDARQENASITIVVALRLIRMLDSRTVKQLPSRSCSQASHISQKQASTIRSERMHSNFSILCVNFCRITIMGWWWSNSFGGEAAGIKVEKNEEKKRQRCIFQRNARFTFVSCATRRFF